jgi:hypothetical protein
MEEKTLSKNGRKLLSAFKSKSNLEAQYINSKDRVKRHIVNPFASKIDKKYKNHFALLGFASFLFILFATYFEDETHSCIPNFLLGFVIASVYYSNNGSNKRPLFLKYFFQKLTPNWLTRKIRLKNKKRKAKKCHGVIRIFTISLLVGIAVSGIYILERNCVPILLIPIPHFFNATLILLAFYLTIPWIVYFIDAVLIHAIVKRKLNESLSDFISGLTEIKRTITK